MTILYYYIKTRLAFLLRHKSFKSSNCYLGGTMYRDYQGSDKKSRYQVLKELNQLAKHWHCYPDSYFIFAMYTKGFGDMAKMKTFIPQWVYGHQYSQNNEPSYEILVNDKILFHDVMRSYGLPVPERLFTYSYGYFKRNGKIIDSTEVDNILSTLTDDRIFIKRNKCGKGSGISVAMRRDDGHYYTDNDEQLSAALILNKHPNSEFIFEKAIVQDPAVARLNPDTVNTCRVLTYKNKVVAGALRMGRKGFFVDNISKGGLVVSLDVDTGQFSEYGLRKFDATKYYEHPDTHIAFKGLVLDNWNEIKALVEKACQLLPYYKSVGYDIACTTDGPVIVEINTGTGVFAPQIGREEGIADVLKKG